MTKQSEIVELPEPVLTGEFLLEQALQQRRSVREYPDGEIALADLGRLLWAAQGITHRHGYRTAPSAGALYPLELYVAAMNVTGLEAGLYHYQPRTHQLSLLFQADLGKLLAQAAFGQDWIREASAVVAFAAVYERTTGKYGKRGEQYVHIEIGHAAQNLFLQAQDLGLGTVDVGAFDDGQVAELLELPGNARPVLLMPVGRHH